jgi:hypothetical protein
VNEDPAPTVEDNKLSGNCESFARNFHSYRTVEMPGLPNVRSCPWICVRAVDWSIHCRRCFGAKFFKKDPTVRQFEIAALRFVRLHKKCEPGGTNPELSHEEEGNSL